MATDLFASGGVPDPATPIAGTDLFADPNAPGPFKKGFGAGVAGVKSNLYGAGALVAHAVGAKALEQAALDKAAAESKIAAEKSQQLEQVDWTSPRSVADQFKWLLGNSLPSLGLMAAGGVVGRGFGALAGRAASTAAGAEAAARVGTFAGAVAPDVALEAGGIYPEALKTGVPAPAARAAFGGAAAASLDFIPLLAAERYLSAAGKGGFGAIVKGALKGAPVGATLEGTQEALQSVVERASAGQPVTGPDAMSDYINSFAGGAVPGAVFGGVIGGHRGTAVQEQAPFTGREQPAEVNAPAPAPAPAVEQPLLVQLADQHTALTAQYDQASQVLDALKAQASQAEADHGAVTQRLDTLKAQLALPQAEREGQKTKEALLVERKALKAQAKTLKASLTDLGTQTTTAQSSLDVLGGQLSDVAGKLTTQYALETMPTGLNPAIAPKDSTIEPDLGTGVIQTKPPTDFEQTQRAVVGVQTMMREQGMLHDLPASKLGGTQVETRPVEVAASRAPRTAVKAVDEQTRQGAVETAAVRAAQPAIKELVSAKNITEAARGKLTTVLTNALNDVAQAAAKLPTNEAAQAHISSEVPKVLKGRVQASDAQEIAKIMSSAVITAHTLYSKGAAIPVDSRSVVAALMTDFGGNAKNAADYAELKAKQTTSEEMKAKYLQAASVLRGETKLSVAAVEQPGRRQSDTGGTQRVATVDRRQDLAGRVDRSLALAQEAEARVKDIGVKLATAQAAKQPTTDLTRQWKAAREEVGKHLHDAKTLRDQLEAHRVGTQASSAAMTSDKFWALPESAKEAAADYYNKAMTDRGNQLIARVRDIVGNDPHLTVTTFTAGPGSPIGGYTRLGPLKASIAMALNANEGLSVADHEGYHYAEDRLLTGAERQIVTNALKSGRPVFQQLLARVRAHDLANKTNLADEVLSQPAEARAYAFEFWRRGELEAEGALARVFRKIAQFFEKIANAVKGLGFVSLEDIFTALDRGQYSERTRNDSIGIHELKSLAETAQWYRSQLNDAVAALSMKAAPAQGWKDTIKGLVAKGAIKQAEVDAVGLNDYLDLQQGKVTKQQVSDFLAQNGVRVEETVLGEGDWAVYDGDQNNYFGTQKEANAWAIEQGINITEDTVFRATNREGGYGSKFASYQLPGGENYRELLLMLPRAETDRQVLGGSPREISVDAAAIETGMDAEGFGPPGTKVLMYPAGAYISKLPNGEFNAIIERDEVTGTLQEAEKFVAAQFADGHAKGLKDFRSSHFDQPNILAHIRFNERTDAEGKRVLFLEEIQSDWAQKGKKEGFRSRGRIEYVPRSTWKPHERISLGIEEGHPAWVAYDRSGYEIGTFISEDFAKQALEADDRSKVPTAPFVSSQKFGVFKENTEMTFDKKGEIAGPDEGQPRRFSTMAQAEAASKKYSAEARDLGQQADTEAWVGLSFKRMIRYAAENGYDRIAWTTGEQQAARYDLSKQIDKLDYYPRTDGKFDIEVRKNGETDMLPIASAVPADKLADYAGKELAEKIRRGEGERRNQGWRGFSGLDLKVGGEGMKAFYNKIVPNVANDVLKKLGGEKVETIQMYVGPALIKFSVERHNGGFSVVDSDGGIVDQYRTEEAAIVAAGRLSEKHKAPAGVKQQPGFTITPELATRAANGLPLFSKAAIAMDRQMTEGELERAQEYQAAAKMIDSAYAHGPDNIFKTAFGALKSELGGDLSRWLKKNILTPNFVAHTSEGFKNVFNTLNTYNRYRAILIKTLLKEQMPQWYEASAADQKAAFGALLDRTTQGLSKDSAELTALLDKLTPQQQTMFRSATKMIEGFLTRELESDMVTYRKLLTTPGAFEEWAAKRQAQVADLIDKGYVPLRRYGDHTVNVFKEITDKQGRAQQMSVAFQTFDRAATAEAVAQMYNDEIARSGAELKVEVGIRHKSARDTTISVQQFIDTARRNGVELTTPERERIVKALSAADSMLRNRLLRRKITPGYSEDGMRVLNEFGVNMSGKMAYAAFGSAIDAASSGLRVSTDIINNDPSIQVDDAVPEGALGPRNLWDEEGPKSGFNRNLADELTDYVLVPDHTGGWSRKLRGAAMMYFIGGSVSGAMVNTMSVPMMVVPELSIHTNYLNGMATTMGAWKTAWRYQSILRDIVKLKDAEANPIPEVDAVPGLRQALITAAEDGRTMDTEIHQIMGMAQGTMYSQSRGVQRAIEAWMAPFRISEQTNRITAFIAGYKVGQKNGLTGRELYNFAGSIVDSTQNNYNEANRPGAARSPIYAIMFMFKSFPLFMVEAATLMYKANPKSAVYMLLGLTMMTGVQGLPFAETLEDLIDTIAQRIFSSPFNSRRAMRNVVKQASEAIVGYDMSELVLRGVINDVFGMSASSRIGAGDFVPGTRLGTADADQGRVLESLLGAPYAMLKDGLSNAGKLVGGAVTGDWKSAVDALRAGGPIAMRNVIKGVQQLQSGYATDANGKKLIDITTPEALWQVVGVSSAGLNKAYEYDRIDKQTNAFYAQVRSDLQTQLSQAIREGDSSRAQDLWDMARSWDESNPDMPLMLSPAAIRRQLVLSGLNLNERTLRTLPRQLRGTSLAAETTAERQ